MSKDLETPSNSEAERLIEPHVSLRWTLLRIAADTSVSTKGSMIEAFNVNSATITCESFAGCCVEIDLLTGWG